MNKTPLVIVGVSLAVVGLVAVFVGYGVYKAGQLDASSKAYVEKNVPPIISTWSEKALLTRSSPQLLKILHAKHTQVHQLFGKLSTLGAMQSFGGVKGQSNVLVTPQHGMVITANYVGDAEFAHGKAKIKVRLVRLAGHWKFLYINVNSPLFMR